MRNAVIVTVLALIGSPSAFADLLLFSETTHFPVPGYYTYDLHVFGTGTVSTFTMNAEVDRGGFYQHPLGSMVAPSENALESAPELAFDTFLGWGGLTQQQTHPNFQPLAIAASDDQILASWKGGPSNLVSESLFLARLTVPGGSILSIQTLLDGLVENLTYQVPVEDPVQIVEGTPPHGSIISFQPGLLDGTGLLEQAIVLKDVHPHGEILPNVPVESLTFPINDHDLFSAISNADDSSIDLVFDIQRAQDLRLKPGTVVNATLIIDPEFGAPLQYFLTATIVPEPSSVGLALAVTALGCAWLRRR